MFFASVLSLGLYALPFTTAAIHEVIVGGSSLVYSPDAISANPGDQVIFTFHQKNHTVSQSSFEAPCALKEGGFTSGFHPVSANETDNFPTYTVTVNDSSPVWIYCQQAANTPASHCGAGMVFAINCPSSGPNTLANFKKAALAVGQSLSAAAAASSTAAASSASAYSVVTAPSATITIPADPTLSTVTATVTLASSTWTTTYGSYPGSAAPTPASLEGTVHTVQVGENGTLTFNPSNITAQPRDIIQFVFHQKNHSVTQSSFAAPCVKLSGGDTPGVDSGFHPVAANFTGTLPTFTYNVSNTSPAWFHCGQTTPVSHCGAGMVFAVNAVENSTHSFAAFQSLAKELNGTSTSSTSSSSTPGSTSGTGGLRVGSNLVLGALAVVALAL